jgi:cell division protein FtsA
MIGQRSICAIDIGDSKITAALAKIGRKGKLDSVFTEETISRGLRNGVISDVSSLSDTIQNTIQALKNRTKINISEVIININGNNIICRHSRATVPLIEKGNKLISNSDVKKVNKQARILGMNIDEELIHEFVQSYTIDNYEEIKNPLGLYGRKISVDLYMIISKTSYISNIVEVLNQAGLELRNLAFSGFVSGLAVLTKEEMQKGCILVNIGAILTEILFFREEVLRHVEILPIGGNKITESITSRLKISWELAEELKKSYVVVFDNEIKEDEEILIKKVSTYKPVKRKQIIAICKDAVDELVEMIKDKIDHSPFKEQLSAGVIITGGGSLLHGLLELIELKIGIPTRLGKIKNISIISSKNPQYSTVIGLIYYYIDTFLAKRNPIQKGKNFFSLLTEQIKYLYQEYF